jgi:hypothetical protein
MALCMGTAGGGVDAAGGGCGAGWLQAAAITIAGVMFASFRQIHMQLSSSMSGTRDYLATEATFQRSSK